MTSHQSQGGPTARSNVIRANSAPAVSSSGSTSEQEKFSSNNFQNHLQLSLIGDSPEKQMLALPRAGKHLEEKNHEYRQTLLIEDLLEKDQKNLQWMPFAVLKYYHVCHLKKKRTFS